MDTNISYYKHGLPTTASGVARQGTCKNYASAGLCESKRRKRGGRRVKRQLKQWKGRRTLIRVGTLNTGTMTRRRRELEDMMEQRNVNILCRQETKWKGSKARNIEGGYKLFYNGADGRTNGIDIMVREELVENVLEVKRVLDRLKYETRGKKVDTKHMFHRLTATCRRKMIFVKAWMG